MVVHRPDAVFVQAAGRYPTFLIKAPAFEVKGIGAFLRKVGQLPVHRGRADAALVLEEAEKRLADGAAVVSSIRRGPPPATLACGP